MIRLLGWGDEAVPPRAAAARGFVPQLETLDGRVVPSRVKIDFCLADTGVPAQLSTVTPVPAVSLVAAPAGQDGANALTGLVNVPGSGEAGFDRVGATWFDVQKTDKDKFEPYAYKGYASDDLVGRPQNSANGLTGPVNVPGSGEAGFDRVWVGGTGWDVTARGTKFHEL
jgi:hypothetical protein